jgi:hypothetical protein
MSEKSEAEAEAAFTRFTRRAAAIASLIMIAEPLLNPANPWREDKSQRSRPSSIIRKRMARAEREAKNGKVHAWGALDIYPATRAQIKRELGELARQCIKFHCESLRRGEMTQAEWRQQIEEEIEFVSYNSALQLGDPSAPISNEAQEYMNQLKQACGEKLIALIQAMYDTPAIVQDVRAFDARACELAD